MALRFAAGVALLLAFASPARAQVDDVALVASGPRAESVVRAFETFVEVPAERRFDEAPEEWPAAAAFAVTIDTETDAVRVWRRADEVTFERRFEGGDDDGYALALVASELLEVVRAGGDPASVGATVVEAAASSETETASETETETVEEAASETGSETEAETPAEGGAVLEFTPGIGVEGWFSVEGDPWIVQPTIFVELLGGDAGEDWRVGGALFVSALGPYSGGDESVEASYSRSDFGVRLSAGGDAGPARTRVLGHLRIGASAIVVSAERRGINDDRRDATRAGWFVGLGLDVRQPLVEGLELFLDVSADALPAPVEVTALGAPLVTEPAFRLGGRLGVAWRIR